MTMEEPPAAWYADPTVPGQLRYWDGRAWTAHLARSGPDSRSPAERDATGQIKLDDPTLTPESVVAEPECRDLAANQPGCAARQNALKLRQAAPVGTFIARALGIHPEERAWRAGADGEEKVAKRLQALGEEWRVIHSLPVGERDSDIDHVVIGPAGVFTLNTKNRSGSKVWVAERSFLVNGQRTDYLRNSYFEADRASKYLSAACGARIPVEPIIVVMAASLTIKAQPPDVHIVAWKQIARWLSRRPAVLTPEFVEEIYRQARRENTWRMATRPPR